jgi:hypothetical protein
MGGLVKLKGIGGSGKRNEAADFLVSLLAGTELASKEVYRLAKEKGISNKTLERAKPIVGLKSRPVYHAGGKAWRMSVPEEMKGRIFSTPKAYPKERLLEHTASLNISSDWVSVTRGNGDDNREKTIIPASVTSSGLRVKVGLYEIEAGENFPADKLAEFLRVLAVVGA